MTPGENIFLRQDEAVRFALRHHAEKIYREKKTPIDPPKGNFTFVNRCGFTGVWLGPPNYHEYQSRLVRHHQQRLRHIPFDEFKSRIQTVKDPEAVKAWIESMSVKSEYECILDAEPKAFATRDELEKHFVETHLAQFITSAPEVRISGDGQPPASESRAAGNGAARVGAGTQIPAEDGQRNARPAPPRRISFLQGPERHHVHRPHQAAAI